MFTKKGNSQGHKRTRVSTRTLVLRCLGVAIIAPQWFIASQAYAGPVTRPVGEVLVAPSDFPAGWEYHQANYAQVKSQLTSFIGTGGPVTTTPKECQVNNSQQFFLDSAFAGSLSHYAVQHELDRTVGVLLAPSDSPILGIVLDQLRAAVNRCGHITVTGVRNGKPFTSTVTVNFTPVPRLAVEKLDGYHIATTTVSAGKTENFYVQAYYGHARNLWFAAVELSSNPALPDVLPLLAKQIDKINTSK